MGRYDEKSGRNRLIYSEKIKGVPVSELAERYNVSLPRIHRICLKEENKALKLENEQLKAELFNLKKEVVKK